MTSVRAWCDWAFGVPDSDRWVIGQRPNLPLGAALGLEGVRRVGRFTGIPGACLGVAGTAAFTWWAVEELTRGVNPWRRALGALGLAGVAWRVRGVLASRR